MSETGDLFSLLYYVMRPNIYTHKHTYTHLLRRTGPFIPNVDSLKHESLYSLVTYTL